MLLQYTHQNNYDKNRDKLFDYLLEHRVLNC